LFITIAVSDDAIDGVDENIEFLVGCGLRFTQVVHFGCPLFIVLLVGLAHRLNRIQTRTSNYNQVADPSVLLLDLCGMLHLSIRQRLQRSFDFGESFFRCHTVAGPSWSVVSRFAYTGVPARWLSRHPLPAYFPLL